MRPFFARHIAGTIALAATVALTSTARGADAPPFEIDSIASLTGQGAFVGRAQQDTLSRLEGVVNREGGIHGRPIHFVISDDQTNPQVAVQLVEQIISKKASVLLGPSLTAPCLAVLPLVQNKLVQYCMSPGIHPAKNSYTFSATPSTTDLIKAFVRYFRGRHWTRVGVLITSDATGQDAEQNIATVLALPENRDVKVVAREYMNVGDLTVAAQIAKIKASNPQALIMWTIGTPTGVALRGMTDAGLDVPVAMSDANMTFPAMKQWAGLLPKDTYFPGVALFAGSSTSAQSKVALQTYYSVTKDQGQTPDFLSGLAWDPAVILVTALRALGTGSSAMQIRDYIIKLHDFSGIMGTYDFRDGNQRGLSERDVVVMRWDPKVNYWVAASKMGGAPLADVTNGANK